MQSPGYRLSRDNWNAMISLISTQITSFDEFFGFGLDETDVFHGQKWPFLVILVAFSSHPISFRYFFIYLFTQINKTLHF